MEGLSLNHSKVMANLKFFLSETNRQTDRQANRQGSKKKRQYTRIYCCREIEILPYNFCLHVIIAQPYKSFNCLMY